MPELSPRSLPEQKRSKQTVKLILDTTAELLEEVGIDRFNTNLLAERSGTRIRTIYRYFPNKLAIIIALAQRWADMEKEWLNNYKAFYDLKNTWREAYDRLIDDYAAGVQQQTGVAALRRAMQAVPELRDIENHANQSLAEEFYKGLTSLGLNLPEKHAKVLSLAIVTASAALLDFAWEEEGKEYRDELVEEVKAMGKNHLASYLD